MLTTVWFFLQLLIWFIVSFSIWHVILKNEENILKNISNDIYVCVFLFNTIIWVFLYALIIACLSNTISFVGLEISFQYKSDLILNDTNSSILYTYLLIQPYYWIIIEFGINILINFAISLNLLDKILSDDKFSTNGESGSDEYTIIFTNKLRQINVIWIIYGFVIWQFNSFNSFNILYLTVIIINCAAHYIGSNLSIKIQKNIYEQTNKCIILIRDWE